MANEYVAGVNWPDPRRMAGYPAVEKEFIRKADAVVTVSPEIANMLHNDYRLPVRPLVVRNTPIRATVGTSAVSVRVLALLTTCRSWCTPAICIPSGALAQQLRPCRSCGSFHLALAS
jgi:hypothetical protein